MKLNKKLLMESIIVSFVIVLLYYGWEVVRGIFLIKNHMPDILHSYTSTDSLQQASSFGIVYQNKWITLLTNIGGFLLILVSYYLIRVSLKTKKHR